MTICLILQHKAYSIVSCRQLCKTVKNQCNKHIVSFSRIESIFLLSPLLPLHSLFYRLKTDKESVNIFFKDYLLSNSLSINALQNLLFCVPKAALLHGKSVGFASQNSRFRNAKSKLPFFL